MHYDYDEYLLDIFILCTAGVLFQPGLNGKNVALELNCLRAYAKRKKTLDNA